MAQQRHVWGSVASSVGKVPGALPGQRPGAQRADDVRDQARRRLLLGQRPDGAVEGTLAGPGGRRGAATRLRRAVDGPHPGLRPRTRELYESELRLHILPALGDVAIGDLTVATVRSWRSAMLRAGSPGPSTVAKCYRLLRAILNTAVEDELITRNPCVLKGAGVERVPERPVVTIAEVYELADAIQPRYRAMVLLAAFGGFRLGELQALTRARVNLLHNEIEVVEQLHELKGGLLTGPPKSDAGIRKVAIPAALKPELEPHLAEHAAPGKDGLLFCGRQGQPIRRSNFNARVAAGVRDRRSPPPPFPRPPAHRQHARRRDRRQHQRADGKDGPRLATGGADLPARHPRARPRHRPGARRHDQREPSGRRGRTAAVPDDLGRHRVWHRRSGSQL